MTYHYGETNQHDCIYNLARKYAGGIEALAPRLGMSVKLLRKKLAPGEVRNQLSFEEATAIMEICAAVGMRDALYPLHAMGFRLGQICAPIPDVDHGDLSQEAIHTAAIGAMRQLAEAMAASSDAMMDDELTETELETIEPKIRGILPAVCKWLERIRARARRDRKPPGVPKNIFGSGRSDRAEELESVGQ
ncbi:phage regulatory CII family protein [Herbaspirillum sp. NPDC101396]|uniref:phage regulatory CII family protein n=1 Tax=Herbaspirillum sp. NPDC101396 TaxID=3364005 RepID=UPI00383B7DEC